MFLENNLGLKRGVPLISELTARFPSFSDNWAVATVYLSAIEIAVKRALAERGEEIEKEFRKNVEKLIDILKKEGKPIGSLDEVLPSAFWDLRNKVVHEGRSPTDEELRMVIAFVKKFLELSLTS